jgi:pimeloyl-ACP methyl ester carboxylesterase
LENKNATDGALTGCGGQCRHCPVIIVPGIGQSRVLLKDKNGNVQKSDGAVKGINFPVRLNKAAIFKLVAMPFLGMMITGKDRRFTDRAAKAVAGCMAANESGTDGKPLHNLEVIKYPKSAARCTPEELAFIYSTIPLKEAAEIIGADHLYYFAYNSFGNNLATAAELYEMIQLVKRETGHSKVNLVPISLGGSIAASLLHFYPQLIDDLNKIIFIVPGINGTKFFADLYAGNLNRVEEFYKKPLTASLKGFKGRVIKCVLNRMPPDTIVSLLSKTIDEIRRMILTNSTVMWGTLPFEDYEAAADKLISDEEHKEIRRQADLYHEAQGSICANIKKFAAAGVPVFDIVDYNHPLHKFVESSKNFNGDGWVNIESASLGATSGRINEPLPAGYVQQNTHCSNPGAHNHISPDGIVDASTGFLPETTFYFANQDHEQTAENDVIIKLISELLLNEEFKDVHAMPERFPQFNSARNTAGIRNSLLPKASRLDRAALGQPDIAELDAAVAECEAMLADTVVDTERAVRAGKRLKDVLNKIGTTK